VSLRLWLRDRRILAATIVLALAAGIAQWLLWWLGPAPTTADLEGPPRSGYTLHDARVTSYDKSGQPSFRLQAPRIDRREGDASLYVDAPKFQLPANEPGIPDWQGQSEWGWVNKGATLLILHGPVEMHRAAFDDTAQAELHTANVSVWPHDKRLATAAPAQMIQGDARINGIGMRANLNEKHLELLDDVHATFPPRQRQGQL